MIVLPCFPTIMPSQHTFTMPLLNIMWPCQSTEIVMLPPLLKTFRYLPFVAASRTRPRKSNYEAIVIIQESDDRIRNQKESKRSGKK